MAIKFSENVAPLSDLKINPGKVVKHVAQTHRPTLLTSRGRGVAIVEAIDDLVAAEEERAFMRSVVAGVNGVESAHEISLMDAKVRLEL